MLLKLVTVFSVVKMSKLFIGRFQPLHKGHKKVIEKNREELTVVIGSAQESGTEKNPLNAEEREEIIRECFPEIEIIYLEDFETDKEWREKLDEKTDADTVLTSNPDVKKAVRPNFDIEEPDFFDPEIYSGDEVRRRIKSDEEWRYLVPGCCKQKLEEYIEKIKQSGIQYEFEPGWKRENAYN